MLWETLYSLLKYKIKIKDKIKLKIILKQNTKIKAYVISWTKLKQSMLTNGQLPNTSFSTKDTQRQKRVLLGKY